jgi:transposase-like protein
VITLVLHCPLLCHGTDIVRHGLSPEGKQRYRCWACREGRGHTFLLDYTYAGQASEVKQQIVDMAVNASGIRDTARVLHVSWPKTSEGVIRCHLRSEEVSSGNFGAFEEWTLPKMVCETCKKSSL